MRDHHEGAEVARVDGHAIKRYIERVDVSATREQAAAAILRDVAAPCFVEPGARGALVVGCHDPQGRSYLAVVRHGAVVSVGPLTFWLGRMKRAGLPRRRQPKR